MMIAVMRVSPDGHARIKALAGSSGEVAIAIAVNQETSRHSRADIGMLRLGAAVYFFAFSTAALIADWSWSPASAATVCTVRLPVAGSV